MAILLALIPIMMIFICLFLFKQTSLRSSLISYAVSVGIVLLSPTFQLGISETVHATIKGWLICFIVGYVLFFGIFISPHEQNGVHRSSGTFSRSSDARSLITNALCVLAFARLLNQ